MTKSAKIWATILFGFFFAVVTIIGVGGFMAATLANQTQTLNSLAESDRLATQDRLVLLEGNLRSVALTDCIIKSLDKTNEFQDCIRMARDLANLTLPTAPTTTTTNPPKEAP